MKLSKKILSALLAVIMSVSLLAGTAANAFADDTLNGSTVIVYTSNLRGDIDILPKIAAIKTEYESKGADVILADTGNFLQGTVYSAADRGYTVFSLMEKTGYDVVSLGIYDFAFGNGQLGAKSHGTLKQYYTLSQLFNGGTAADAGTKDISSIKAVSTNVSGSNSYFTFDKNMVNYSAVTTPSGKRIGFIGLTEPKTKNMILEESIEGIDFDKNDNMYTQANAAAKYLSSKSDAVICLSNAEALNQSKLNVSASIGKAADTQITIGAVVLDSECNIVSDSYINTDDFETDSIIQNEVNNAKSELESKFTLDNYAVSEITLNGAANSVRSEETNLGDLWADALLWYGQSGKIADYYNEEEYENGNMAVNVEPENIIAVWNGGNLRDYLYQGQITLQDIQRVLPYPNTMAIAYVKGTQIKEALEASMQYAPAFASVAGIDYSVNAHEPFVQGEQYPSSNYYKPSEDSHKIVINSVNGYPFNENEVYAVITSNFISNGGDTYSAFKEKIDGFGSTVTTRKVTDAVWEYINQQLGGVIGEKYNTPQNRIHIIDPHTVITDKAVPASCTQTGLSEGAHCSTCGTVIKEQETIAYRGHIYLDGVAGKNATCTEPEKITYTCARCNQVKTEIIKPAAGHKSKTTLTKAKVSQNGKIVKVCTVCKKTLSSTVIPKIASIKLSSTSYTYNGKVKTPAVTVKDSKGKTLKKNTDYTVTYAKGRKNVGKYTVTIKFKGNYSGTVKKTFTIKPKATSISKLTAGKKKFTVKWKKLTTQTTGYQIQYSTSSKFKSAKTVTIGKNKTTSKVISKLKAKKKYYVRVRTYKTVKINGKNTKIYSSWSKAKSITTKK